MSPFPQNARILMYSHDTFGLGHLRRCRTIAHSLVDAFSGLRVLIISGATIAGAFDYRARVDFVKIPSVIKLRNGEYTSMNRHIDLHDTLKMRQSIIRHTAETFEPDIFIVDKEPMGLRREVEETLVYLKTRGTALVLGLREVMDAPHLLKSEWERNDVLRKVDQLYDDIWVYGPPDFYDPLLGLEVPQSLRAKMNFVGFLQRQASSKPRNGTRERDDYILVTTGGGGDGSDLIRDVINAYDSDPTLTQRALLVLGPYMPAEQRQQLTQAGARNPALEIIEFDNRMEDLIAGAKAVVAMGGYNTYCEILSFDKPALIIPRIQPREEQLIRALRAHELGLVDMLHPDESVDGPRLSQALKDLLKRPPPSVTAPHMQLDGLSNICQMVNTWLGRDSSDHLSVVQGGLPS
ncbi:glycosyltransferase family protein [Neorhizobium sp. Rsf11]|uniref:Glycosyltransferase family protein n=2 Tax=Neorhizobium TaxID=1525371 RepID=A0ABV0M550_9HYPH|nr:glycosyltransferase family protein [Neorhizobium petrolearium]MCC2612938.1 glycosyltransferase family protein [Neorhizobium petrolearium]WGI71329.1 glycosyltransferase family protein [Neorhizobium petrolearium]